MENKENKYLIPLAIVVAGTILSLTILFKPTVEDRMIILAEANLLEPGHLLPTATEERMLEELIERGVIDPGKLSKVSELNLLWAFGLANKNAILEKGEMVDPKYGGVENFASTGGWTVAMGNAMDHYSMHEFISLTGEEQNLVDKVSQNVYRPCCRNSAHFPDCNHGMAMLGLLEVLASEGATEEEMVQASKVANADWFPGTYGPVAPKVQGGCSV